MGEAGRKERGERKNRETVRETESNCMCIYVCGKKEEKERGGGRKTKKEFFFTK